MVYLSAQFGVVLLQVRVRIPAVTIHFITMKNLHKPHALFDESACSQADMAKRPGVLLVQSVKLSRHCAFFLEVENFRNLSLHAESEFVGFDPCSQHRIARILYCV